MKIEVITIKGEKTNRTVELPDDVFGITPNDHAIYLDVKRILANKRQGTHSTKTRSDMSGSTKKLFRQKGTGGARRGDVKSPLLSGGGRVFGPHPHEYEVRLNKKVRQLARKSALSYKMSENRIMVLEDFTLETPKTKEFAQILKNLNVEEKKNLFITAGLTNNNLHLSLRNIPNSYICTPEKLNTYDILNNENLLFTESAVEIISKTVN
jgi:large subunit ribosomal protein L4